MSKRYFYITISIKAEGFSGNGYSFLETNGSYPYFMEVKRQTAQRHSGLTPDNIVILSVIEFNSYQDFIDARDGMNEQ